MIGRSFPKAGMLKSCSSVSGSGSLRERGPRLLRGRGEGVESGYHRKFDDAEGASYLYWVGDDADSTAFQDYLVAYPGAVDLWLAGHTHTHPDDRYGGKSHIESRWGVTFVNVSALTRHHALSGRPLYTR